MSLYPELRDRLSDALLAIDLMRTSREFRLSMAKDLREFGIAVPELILPTARLQSEQLLDAALARAGGLTYLAGRVTRHDRSHAANAFYQLSVLLLPEPYLTLRDKTAAIESLAGSARSERFGAYYHAIVGRDPTRSFDGLWDLVTQLAQDKLDVGAGQLDPLLHVMALITRDTTDEELRVSHRMRVEGYATAADPEMLDRLRLELAQPAGARQPGSGDNAYADADIVQPDIRQIQADARLILDGVQALLLQARTAPVLATPGSPPRQLDVDLLDPLVDAMQLVPSFADYNGRNSIINALRPDIRGTVPRSPIARIEILNTVKTAAGYTGGLADLLTVLRTIEGDSDAMRHLDATILALKQNDVLRGQLEGEPGS